MYGWSHSGCVVHPLHPHLFIPGCERKLRPRYNCLARSCGESCPARMVYAGPWVVPLVANRMHLASETPQVERSAQMQVGNPSCKSVYIRHIRYSTIYLYILWKHLSCKLQIMTVGFSRAKLYMQILSNRAMLAHCTTCNSIRYITLYAHSTHCTSIDNTYRHLYGTAYGRTACRQNYDTTQEEETRCATPRPQQL